MGKVLQVRTLSEHFFRKFFPSEAAGEDMSNAAMVRALAVVAAPTLMVAFWIALLAKNLHGWRLAGVHSFFVTYAFCAVGCLTAMQWENLFPDRIDFLILLPLPLRPGVLFLAKLRAAARLLLLFAVAANAGGTLLLPTLEGWSMPRAMAAHAVAVFSASLAAALFVLAAEATIVLCTPSRWFRMVSLLAQTTMIALFVLLFFRAGLAGNDLGLLLHTAPRWARFFPLLWFEALYESVVGGITATPFAHRLARFALLSMPLLAALVAVVYPAAWVRRQRMAIEGTRSARLRENRAWKAAAHTTFLRRPDSRAVFYFIRQTLSRLSRYHVLLAAYCGVGLALSVTLAVSAKTVDGHLHIAIWKAGLFGSLPLLMFWTVAGLQVAFLLPESLGARWIFRLARVPTSRVVSTTKLLVLLAASLVIALYGVALLLCGWRGLALCEQLVFGAICAVLLTDVFFYFQSYIPFTRPRTSNLDGLPLTLAVFVFGAPVSILLTLTVERWVAETPWKLGVVCGSTALFHLGQRRLRMMPSHAISDDAFLGENDAEVQTLGLST